jgi:hypothetical protein
MAHLLAGVWETIQRPALRLAVCMLQALQQQLHEQPARHRLAAVHVALCLKA